MLKENLGYNICLISTSDSISDGATKTFLISQEHYNNKNNTFIRLVHNVWIYENGAEHLNSRPKRAFFSWQKLFLSRRYKN